jgi:hypothetical protein
MSGGLSDKLLHEKSFQEVDVDIPKAGAVDFLRKHFIKVGSLVSGILGIGGQFGLGSRQSFRVVVVEGIGRGVGQHVEGAVDSEK